jgi:hypothetical protein
MKNARMLASLMLLACGALPLSSCGESAKTDGGLDGAQQAYLAGDYNAAHEQAVDVLRSAKTPQREQAAYLAGISAYRTGRLDEAELRLLTSAGSADTTVSGRSKATLGLIRNDQHRHGDAARYFADASRLLTGAEATQASLEADRASRAVGGAGWAGGSSGESVTEAAGSGAAFAIQVGAFQSMENAAEAAAAAKSSAERHHLGDVRILPRPDGRGRTLYFVQFGRFSTRSAAESMRSRVGEPRYIIAPAIG